jgi:hypothetical protein
MSDSVRLAERPQGTRTMSRLSTTPQQPLRLLHRDRLHHHRARLPEKSRTREHQARGPLLEVRVLQNSCSMKAAFFPGV